MEDAGVPWSALNLDLEDADEIREQRLLDAPIRSTKDAAALAEALALSLEIGERSDGRDVRALHRLANWLRRQVDLG